MIQSADQQEVLLVKDGLIAIRKMDMWLKMVK